MKRFSWKFLSILLCMVLLLSGSQAGAYLQAPTDPGQILAEAYALEKGMSLPYDVTLTGVVTQIQSPYEPDYQNISVVIQVSGYEQMPILCYRLSGENTDILSVKDTVTVRGCITNDRGTIKFKQGCILESMVEYKENWSVPADAAKLDAAYQLEEGASLPYMVHLTGKIVSVDTPWDNQFQNITVTIVIPGRETKPVRCCRLAGENAPYLRVGDEITVFGTLTKDNGMIRFQQGCRLDNFIPHASVENLIVSGTATFTNRDEAAEGFGAQFIPAANGTITVAVTDCTPGYCLEVYSNNDLIQNFYSLTPKTYILDVCQGVTYNIYVYTTKIEDATLQLWDYAPGSVSVHITSDVAAGEAIPEAPSPDSPEAWPSSMAIVGSSLPGIEEWDPADPAGDMTQVAEGVYHKQLVFDQACSITFKFVGNDTWDPTWSFGGNVTIEYGIAQSLERGMDSTDLTLKIDAPCTLDIYLDLSRGADYPLLFVGVEYPMTQTRQLHVQVPDSWDRVYAYTWDHDGNSFLGDWPGTELEKDGQWYCTRISYDETGLILSNGMNMTDDLYLEVGADVWITVSPETDEVGKNRSSVSYNDPLWSTDHIYRITGNAPWLGNWDPAFEGGRMAYIAPGVYWKTFKDVPAGEYEFRITQNGSWASSLGDADGNNYFIKLTRQTDLTVFLTFRNGFGEISIPDDPPIVGDTNGDFKLNVADVSKLYAHIRGTSVMTEPPLLKAADFNGDGKLNVGDVSKLYAHIRGMAEKETTQQKIVDQAYSLATGEAMEQEVTLRGKIIQVDQPYSPEFRNISVSIVVSGRETKPILCYRLKGDYVDRLAVGDVIEVTGLLQNYNGKIEFATGCRLISWDCA